MATRGVPQGGSFAYGNAVRSLDEQLRLLDALDSKAGILIAANGLLAGLIFGRGSFLTRAPSWLSLTTGVLVLASLLFALFAFLSRLYETAPAPEAVARFAQRPEDWLQWRFITNVLDAIEVNRKKLALKGRLLSLGQASLIAAIAPLGGYFVWARLTGRL